MRHLAGAMSPAAEPDPTPVALRGANETTRMTARRQARPGGVVTDTGEIIALWAVLGALSVGPVYAAFLTFLRHPVDLDALVAKLEALVRAGDHGRVAQLLSEHMRSSHRAPTVELLFLAWSVRFEALEEGPPIGASNYREPLELGSKPYADRMRERLAGDYRRLLRRVEWSALPAITGLAAPTFRWVTDDRPPTAAWWLAGLVMVISVAAFGRSLRNEHQLRRAFSRHMHLFDPSSGGDDGRMAHS
jgi:hypothetical protein